MARRQTRSMLHSVFSQDPLIPEPPPRDSKNSDAPPPIVVHRLDFGKLGLPGYQDKFAMVIDNLFTPEDCARYVATAEASKDWDAAAINVGPGPQGQVVDTTYRNSSRIIYDDHDMANEIFERLKPYLGEIQYIKGSPLHKSRKKGSNDLTAQFVALNERLRFLKYGPGQFFRNHCDGTYATPDGKRVSYYTLQLYLNGSAGELQGGATRFWRSGGAGGPEKGKGRREKLRPFIDVEPRVGRALIFEQQGMLHSGEEVKKGLKITMRTDLMFEVCPKESTAEAPK